MVIYELLCCIKVAEIFRVQAIATNPEGIAVDGCPGPSANAVVCC